MVAAILFVRRNSFAVNRVLLMEYAGAGLFISAHWVLFYASAQEDGPSMAALFLSTITFFTALTEPIFFARKPRRHELVIGLLVVVGVILLGQEVPRLEPRGFALGIGSALFSALFGAWNGRIMMHPNESVRKLVHPLHVTFYEMLFGALWISLAYVVKPSLFVWPSAMPSSDWGWLFVLSFVCTVLPWMWSLRILSVLSPYTISVATTLETVYSLVLAYFIFPGSEQLSTRFYVGASVLIGLCAVNGWLKSRSPAQPKISKHQK